MPRALRHTVSCLTALALALPSLAPPALAQTVTIEECRTLADADVQAKIRELTEKTLKTELSGLDYRQLVNNRWPEARMSARIDAAVEEAVKVSRADKTWLDRAYSNISRETAEKYAIEVAGRAYGGQGFKDALTDLSNLVGRDLGERIERSASKVSGPVIACVQTTLQARYGAAMSEVFARETEQSVNLSPQAGSAKIESTDLAFQGGATISGIILVVTRQVIARMVAGIGTRIAGAIATRIVSTFTGLIGLALIAADLYQAGDGVFPLIEEKMKSDESKDVIKDEFVKTLETDVAQQLAAIGEETAARIYSLWLGFRQKYAKLLELGDKSPAFAAFLRDRRIDQLERLGRLVEIVLAADGDNGVFMRTADGSLSRALVELNDTGVGIADSLKSIDLAMKWKAVAGADLDKVARLELHKALAPDAIDQAQLQKLLGIEDNTAIIRLAKLEPGARDLLLGLPAAQVRDLAIRLNESELAVFSNYQRQLSPTAARRVVAAIGEKPSALQQLAREGVQQAIFGSGDQLAALDMLLRQDSPVPDLARVHRDYQMVSEGRVHYRIFWERHWAMVLFAAFLAFVILAWFKRLIFGSARR